jgi:prevent-host-death family protein
MKTVGIYEARTKFAELVDEVARGTKVTITRRGKAVAVLSAPPRQDERKLRQVVKEMLERRDREGPTLGEGLTIRDLIEEGRRF